MEVALDGFSERSQRLGLNKITYKLNATYADDRAKAQWKLSSIDQYFEGKADLPTVLTGNKPLMVDLKASNIWMVKLHKVLPPALANVDGRLDGTIKASGTTARPVLAVDLHGRGWELGPDSKNNDVRLKVDYKERKLNARAEVHLQQSLGKDAGALVAQLELPIDAAPAKLHGAEAPGRTTSSAHADRGGGDADAARPGALPVPADRHGAAADRRHRRRLDQAARHAACSRTSTWTSRGTGWRAGRSTRSTSSPSSTTPTAS